MIPIIIVAIVAISVAYSFDCCSHPAPIYVQVGSGFLPPSIDYRARIVQTEYG